MDNSHGNYNFIFHFRFTDHIKLPDEMLSNSNQCILRPSLQPVDCATTDQTWEFQCTTSELLSNLWVIKVQSMIFDVFGRDQYSLQGKCWKTSWNGEQDISTKREDGKKYNTLQGGGLSKRFKGQVQCLKVFCQKVT